MALLRFIIGKRRSLFQTFIEYLKYERDLRGFISKSETRKIMGNIGFIFGYAIIGAFLLGAVVGYYVEKIGEKICGKEH